MSSKTGMVANLTLDMKRNRIRIYRATLRALGDPAYIQFLINPEELYIAILGSEIPLSGGTANRVKIPNSRLDGKLSVEFYSAALLDGIYSIFGVLDREYNYRLTGEIDQVNRVAYFSLRTLKRIERRKLNDGQGV
ncbi:MULTISPECIES: hypothetical protein [Eubacteriales]|jgi:hypothetical protein|uniref:hypothetical protein n=1 Tax=Eubacteriales TaxID=186802 RepID=UPI0018988CF5|nr:MULTISPECIES: hypothetical protein [Eubacteriales]MDF1493778.1 hypothetical protein [Caproiciproducens sp. CPB-2]